MSDIEDVVLQQDPYGPARDTSALLRSYGGFRSRLPDVGAQHYNCIRSRYMYLL